MLNSYFKDRSESDMTTKKNKRYFENRDSTHNKFWQIEWGDTWFTTSWGKIGTLGQSTTKTFFNSDVCFREREKIINSKLNKGYAEVKKQSKSETKDTSGITVRDPSPFDIF